MRATLLLLVAACAHPASPAKPSAPAPAPLTEVLEPALARTAAEALPAAAPERVSELADLLDLASAGGRLGERAQRSLQEEDPVELSGAILALLEAPTGTPEARRAAYAWLRERAAPGAMPRLTLRLKYEKDWVANVDLALALLRLGSGAGLDTLTAILREESRQEPMFLEARAHAAAALLLLPPRSGWTPGADFAADWARLQEVEGEWLRTRAPLAPVAPAAAAAIQAEVWRVLGALRSQPLRPVDDARFVLVRLPAELAYAPLLAVTRERNLYARDHALETISWIGPPFGAWSTRAAAGAVEALAPGLGEITTRPRVLEALGATGLPAAAPLLLPWLDGNAEESTAAADGLLRCADASQRAPIAAALARPAARTPEAAYSLALLLHALDPTTPAAAATGLDAAETARRDAYLAARSAFNR